MALPFYLAMTAAEMGGNQVLPPAFGYMACHFSPYRTGLSNCPCELPPGAMLLLDDSTPMAGHDPILITRQLAELVRDFGCSRVLLDFQRPGIAEAAALAKQLACALPCPVGVSELYAKDLECPVFLPPVPCAVPLEQHLAPWRGREVWLEMALDGQVITLTPEGANTAPLPPWEAPADGHREEKLHCHYYITMEENTAKFTLFRTRADVEALMAEAEALGVTTAVGLWQEWEHRL